MGIVLARVPPYGHPRIYRWTATFKTKDGQARSAVVFKRTEDEALHEVQHNCGLVGWEIDGAVQLEADNKDEPAR